MGHAKQLEELDERLDAFDYYQLIDVPPLSDYVAIHLKYQDYAPNFHPDRFGAPPQKEKAERVTKRLHEAYGVLSDPLLRPQYDLVLKDGILRLDADIRSSNVARVRELAHPFARAYLHSARRRILAKQYKDALTSIRLARSCFDCDILSAFEAQILAQIPASARSEDDQGSNTSAA